MFEEAQYDAPRVTDSSGAVRVQLGRDHPGFADPEYRERRDALATLAARWQPGQPCPTAPYTEVEHDVWRAVSEALHDKHLRYACREYLDSKQRLGLPTDRVPQLEEVSDTLEPLTGFRYLPAAGLVPLRDFYGALADRRFWSTQYVRHHSLPLYTPEPDVIHEVIGHGNTLASERFVRLLTAAGGAARRVETEDALEFVSRVFWFTLEFGLVHEPDGLKAYGAGILSSAGEIEQFRTMEHRPIDIAAMAAVDYDITAYQPVLYRAESVSEIVDVVGWFFATCDDESIASLRSAHAGVAR
jgi:phenylalanine-4-hydroxylase